MYKLGILQYIDNSQIQRIVHTELGWGQSKFTLAPSAEGLISISFLAEKKKALILILILAIGLASFAAGYYFRLYEFTPDMEMEEYALTNILLTVSNESHIGKFDLAEFKQNTDVNLDMHLRRVRRYSSFQENSPLAESRLATLNSAYCYWSNNPPFFLFLKGSESRVPTS